MRKHLIAAFALAALVNSAAFGATDPATWQRDLERLDYYTTNPNGGDNAFFTYVANATAGANVVLLYPANSSMNEFPKRMYDIRAAGGNCGNTFLNGLKYFMPTNAKSPAAPYTPYWSGGGGYDPAIAYPDPGLAYTNSGQTDGLGAVQNQTEDKAYQFGTWPGPGGAGTGSRQSGLTDGAMTVSAACGANATCINCITTNGYWINPAPATTYDNGPTSAVFHKNFLRFYPTKATILSLAYKRLVNGPLLAPLREAVIATDVSAALPTGGSKLVQKMLPQSCNGNGRPLNQKLDAIDGLKYTSAARPLAELLFNTAWYMGSQDNPWVWTTPGTFPGAAPYAGWSNTKSGPCNGCNSDFAILFSDGRSDVANPACIAAGNPAWCTAANACGTLALGTELDGDDWGLNPALGGDVAAKITGVGPLNTVRPRVSATPYATCDMDFADDVAYWAKNNNISSLGTSASITTYVVGIGDNLHGEMNILRNIAYQGGSTDAKFADDFVKLEDQIENVFTLIRGAASSFASSAVTTVQTTGTSSAFIPRFTPAITGTEWKGSLSRFVLFNEFAAGCTQQNIGNLALNPNANGSCSDFYLRDSNGAFIQEDGTGQFVVSNTSAAWVGGWPAVVLADGGSQLAVPYWEAGAKLTSREQIILAGGSPPAGARQILTVIPTGNDYGTTSGSTRAGGTGPAFPGVASWPSGQTVEFKVSNAATLAPSLGLGTSQNSEMCLALSAASGNQYASLTECAADVIRFVHGEDVLDQNPFNRTTPPPVNPMPRVNVLGDIFHSSPILVTPPAPRFLCDLGVLNQCVASLYSPTLTPGGATQYVSWFNSEASRDQNVLVGANDGMLHAFNAARMQTDGGFDTGTGEETWAFIAPDLLPKIVRTMIGERHEMFADGTPMVRDIWVDGSGASSADNAKQSDEYHTIVVFAERQGGRGYTALDITNPNYPVFLWTWPRPGTREALTMGQSWNDLGGSPPAIGPVAKYNNPAGPLTVNGDKAQEQYVVAIGGGYDPNYIRGRSMHVLDAWTGAEVYRFSSADNTGGTDPRKLIAPVPAPISMIDVDSDGLFDHAVFGDLDGNVWNLSMMKPGRDTGSDGLYDTWYMGLAFNQFENDDFRKKSPFFQRISTGMLPTGDIRIYLGSGDRAHLKDFEGGVCSPDDLSACMKRDCSFKVTPTNYTVGPPPSGSGGHSISGSVSLAWPGSGGVAANNTTNALTYSATSQSSATTWVTNATLSYDIDCPSGSNMGTQTATALCTWGAALPDGGTDVDCPGATPLGTVTVAQAATPTIQDTRFYSIKLFDTGTRAKFMTQAGADTYTANALSDVDLNDISGCPAAPCNLSVVNDNGWLLTHGTAQTGHKKDEKTAASALLFGGCVLWSTLDPVGVGGSSGSGGGTCVDDTTSSVDDPFIGGSCQSNADCYGGNPPGGTCIIPGSQDYGDSCDNDNDCDGWCLNELTRKCDRNSDCRNGGTCGFITPPAPYTSRCSVPQICSGLGSLSCNPTFPKDTAYSYQADAINGGISCGLAGSQTYLATNRSTARQVSVAPTQPAPVVSVNAATGMIQYSAVTLDASSVPTGATLGASQISSTVHWLEVGRKVHDCRHGVSPGTDCVR